jgi:hypothetical protein
MATIESLDKELSDLGVKLETARARLQKNFGRLNDVMARAELLKDNKAVYDQVPLNRAIDADRRLILQLERQEKDMKKQADLARAQQAHAASRAAPVTPESEKTRWFIVVTPQGREVRHKHRSSAALQAELLPGYCVAAEVYNADDSGNYGSPVAVGQRAAILQHCQEQSA